MFNTEDITVLLAAAGCGKTHYLKKQVRNELNSVRSIDIAFVSFTRKGSEIGKQQVMKMTGLSDKDLPYFKTLNSLTFSALGYESKNIFNTKHAKKLNSLIGSNISLHAAGDSATEDDKILSLYDALRSGLSVDDTSEYVTDMVRYRRIVEAYESYKKVNGLYDYIDCFLNFVERGEAIPVPVVFIDEAQDLTALQWDVCYTAFSKAQRIYIAGDDYQSIYTFSGARPDILIDFANKYKLVKREKSYRLPQKVYEYARAITDLLVEKVDKDYVPAKGIEGSVEKISSLEYLIDMLSRRQDEHWLVLYRNNYHSLPVQSQLQAMGVPFHTANGFVLNEDKLSLIKRYYQFRLPGYSTPEQKEAFAIRHGIRDFSLPIEETGIIEGDEKYLYALYLDKFDIDTLIAKAKKPCITLSTIHRVKGDEAKNVVVFLDCSTKVYVNRLTNLDSELRLLYVAFTRAEENLYLVKGMSGYGMDDIVSLIEEGIK